MKPRLRFFIHKILKAIRRKKLILGAVFIAFYASIGGCGNSDTNSSENKTAMPETKKPVMEIADKSTKGKDTIKTDNPKKKSKVQKKKIKVHNDSLKQKDFINTCYFRIMNK
jgi:hypothetical protein